jgi:hypothetical protein
MMGRLKEILGDWLDVLCSLLTFPGAALFGLGLCWLLGSGGPGGQSPLDASINGKLDSDQIRYEFGSEAEKRMVTIFIHASILRDESGFATDRVVSKVLLTWLSCWGVWDLPMASPGTTPLHVQRGLSQWLS